MTTKNTLLLIAGILCISLGVFSIFSKWNDTFSGASMGMGIGLNPHSLILSLKRL